MPRKSKELKVLDNFDSGEGRFLLEAIAKVPELIELHGLKPKERAFREISGLISVWVLKKSDTYSKGSVRHEYYKRICSLSAELAGLLQNADIRMHRWLELDTNSVELKFDTKKLIDSLVQLSGSASGLSENIEHQARRNTELKETREHLIKSLYRLFKETTKDKTKHTYYPDKDSHSGDFFFLLRDFYRLIKISKTDGAIAKDMDRSLKMQKDN